MLPIESIGFVLAIDGCGRGCSHCPAFGLGAKPIMTPIDELRSRLRRVRAALPTVDFATAFRTVHAWRISDLLDYRYTVNGVTYDVMSVAEAWVSELGQPLYLVTNGSLGSPGRRASMAMVAKNPDLFSQIKLTITPFDPRFERSHYAANMAYDVAMLWELGELPGRRFEAAGQQRRFRINVKAAAHQLEAVQAKLREILGLAGLNQATIDTLLTNTDPRLQIKPVYDLRANESQPLPKGAVSLGSIETRLKPEEVRDRHQLGIRPDGSAFQADMWRFSESDLADPDGRPLTFDDWFLVVA